MDLARVFPVFKFHRTEKPRKLNTQADLDSLELEQPNQWFNSPAEAASGESINKEVDLAPPLEAGGAGKPANYVAQQYPKFLFHKVHKPRKVKDPAAQAELGEGWYEDQATADNPPAAPPTTPYPGQQIDPLTPEQVSDLHATSVKDITDMIGNVDSVVLLDQLIEAEQARPDGARKGALSALAARRAELEK